MNRLTSCARAAARTLVLAAAGALLPAHAQPVDEAAGPGITWSVSAFGTIGWAQTNRAWGYQRFLRDDGGVERDTLFGAQLDVQLAPRWSATLQARLAPSVKSDDRWSVVPSWAFVAWRPADDLLLRMGKLRVPLFLRSEQLDVGQTYDEARLPAELYSLAPTNDFAGMHLARTWPLPGGELGTEAYWGHAELTKRFWLREGMPPQLPAGALFQKVDTTIGGLVAIWRREASTWRVGLHRTSTYGAEGNPLPVRPTQVPLGPGISYWQTSNLLPGPGVATVPRIHNTVLLVGGETELGQGWRVAGEVGRVWQHDTELGSDAVAGYLTVYRRVGRFTPYATVAAAHTLDRAIDWARTLDTTQVPGAVPGAAMLNASMRLRADLAPVYHQASLALGSSWAATPRSKVKAEWMRTRAHQSQLIDLAAGEPLHQRRHVDVLSVSYSFVY